jgi:CRP-like cAMP-binding protein
MISPETLRRYTHFAGLSEDCLKEVALISEERPFNSGDRIFEESSGLRASARIYEKGEEATHLLILVSGEVDIVYSLADGEEVVVGTLVGGDLMAISALIPPYQLTASGIAKKDGRLIAIAASELRALCESDPVLGYRLMAATAVAIKQRLTDTRVQLAGASS